MRGKSHQQLGQYLVHQHFTEAPKRYRKAFLFGCTEPDRNPTTYFKGSIRSQWLRGHNWGNAEKYMQRVAKRLEKRSRLHLWDYYSMGKLIHYTADAFTSAHNDFFPKNLQEHRDYEHRLQNYFLSYLMQCRCHRQRAAGSIMDAIRFYHRQYAVNPISVKTDCRYSVYVTSLVVATLMA